MLLLDWATPLGPPDPSGCLTHNGSCFTPKFVEDLHRLRRGVPSHAALYQRVYEVTCLIQG